MQCKNIVISVVFGLLLASGLTIAAHEIQAAPVEYPVSLFCRPDVGKVDLVGVFSQAKGEALTVHCEIANSSKDKSFSGFVLGKQVFEGQALASTGDSVVLRESDTTNVTLTFPGVFQGGEYQYTFSFIDPSTSQSLSHDAYLLGNIQDEKIAVKIGTSTFDRERFGWQDTVQLMVNLDVPQGVNIETGNLSLHVTLDGVSGLECAVLMDKQVVTKSSEALSLTFPVEGACANQMTISLRASDGGVVDQKILAVGLPERKPTLERTGETYRQVFDKVPRSLVVFLVLTGILVLGLGGTVMLRRKSS